MSDFTLKYLTETHERGGKHWFMKKKTIIKTTATIAAASCIAFSPVMPNINGLSVNGCYALAAVSTTYTGYIDSSDKSVGQWTLDSTTGLLAITVNKNNTKIDSKASQPWANYRTNIKSVSITAASGVNSVRINYWFEGCTNLTAVKMPDCVTHLTSAFKDCTSLTQVTIPTGAKYLTSCFAGCKSLKTVTNSTDLGTEIVRADYMFSGCSNLEQVTLLITDKMTAYVAGQDYTNGIARIFENCPKVKANLILAVNPYDKKTNTMLVDYRYAFSGAATDNDSYIHIFRTSRTLIIDNMLTNGSISGYVSGDTVSKNSNHITTRGIVDITKKYIGSASNKNYIYSSVARTDSSGNETEELMLSVFGSGTMFGTSSAFTNTDYKVSSVGRVYIENGITSISSDCFKSCVNLNRVVLGNNVTSIGDTAFSRCTSLATINFPSALKQIGGGSFSNCEALTSVTLPDDLTSLSKTAFKECTNLESVNIPSGSIGVEAFGGCKKLSTVTLGEKVTSINTTAFSSTAITTISIPKSATVGTKVFDQCKKLRSVNFDCNTIPSNVFDGCTDNTGSCPVTTINVGENVKVINSKAFTNALISNITIPSNVQTIGSSAFLGCKDLSSVTLGCKNISDHLFSDADETDICPIQTLVLTDGIASVSDRAFAGLDMLAGIEVPHISGMGKEVFANCNSLTNVRTASDVTSGMFDGCPISSLSLNEGVTAIAANAFKGMSDITQVDFPSSLKNIGANAFEGTGLTKVIVPASVEMLAGCAFKDTNVASAEIYAGRVGAEIFSGCGEEVPMSSLKVGDSSQTYLDDYAFRGLNVINVEIGAGVVGGKGAFTNCKSLVSVLNNSSCVAAEMFKDCSALQKNSIGDQTGDYYEFNPGDGVTIIGESAFEGCASIKRIAFSPKTTTIGSNAFANSGLSRLAITEGITQIGSKAFSGCTELTYVTIDSNCNISTDAFSNSNVIKMGFNRESIPANIMKDSTSLKYLGLSDSVINIGASAFSNSGLIKVVSVDELENVGDITSTEQGDIDTVSTFPNNVSIGRFAFSGSKLISLNISSGAVATNAFEGCTALTSISLVPDTNEDGTFTKLSVAGSAFKDCTALSDIVMGMESVPTGIFEGMTSVKNVSFMESVQNIEASAFRNTGIGSIGIPATVKNVESYAFAECAELSDVQINGGTIFENAFNNCKALTNITVTPGDNGETPELSSTAFSDCENVENVEIGITNVPRELFKGCSKLTNIILNDGVKTIGSLAFNGTGIGSVAFPPSIVNVGEDAFSACPNLTNVAVTSGDFSAAVFNNCTNLESADIDEAALDSEDDSIESVKLSSETFKGCALSSISLRMKDIPEKTFEGMTTLSNVVLEDGVQTIGVDAFASTGITSVSIPDSVTSINDGVFKENSNLVSVTFPETITSIGTSAFENCPMLQELVTGDNDGNTLPGSLITIKDNAFNGCSRLEHIDLLNNINLKEVGIGAFTGCADNFYVDCSPESVMVAYGKENGIKTRYLKGIYAKYDGEVIHGMTPDTSCISLYYVYSTDEVTDEQPYLEDNIIELPEDYKFNITWPETFVSGKMNEATLVYNGITTTMKFEVAPAEVTSISARYTSPDGVLEGCSVPKSAITVTARYTDKHEEDLDESLWEIEEGYTIRPDELNSLRIVYTNDDGDEITTTVSVPGIRKSVVRFKAELKSGVTPVKYSTLDLNSFVYSAGYDNMQSDDEYAVLEDQKQFIECLELNDGYLTDDKNELVFKYTDSSREDAATIEYRTIVTAQALKVSLVNSSASMNIGDTCNIEIKSNNSEALNYYMNLPETKWVSVNGNVASVTKNGEVTALDNGTSDISIKIADTVLTFKVKVSTASVDLTLDKSSISLMKSNKATLKYTIYPGNSSDKIKWSSSNKAVATVNSKGVIKAVGAGKCTVYARTSSGKKAKCIVKVFMKPNMIKLDRTSATIKKGKKITLKYKLPSYSKASVKWSSSNKKVASVSQKGIVKALRKGNTYIVVKTSNGKKAKCRVTVK